jgi:ribosomal protein S18 acetylase RimI-like enzyme
VDVTARPATADDLPALVTLATAAIEELTPHRGGDVWRRQQARSMPPGDSLLADLDDPDTHVVVGTVDDTAVGYGVLRVEHLRDGSHLGVISDLFTLDGAREVSVGEEMMDALVAWAGEQGCFGVDSLALPGDRATKNFFESFGLVARAIVVHRPLGER